VDFIHWFDIHYQTWRNPAFRGLATAPVNTLSQTCARPTEIYIFSPRTSQFLSWPRQRWLSSPWCFNLRFYWQAKIPVKISRGFSTGKLRQKQNKSNSQIFFLAWK